MKTLTLLAVISTLALASVAHADDGNVARARALFEEGAALSQSEAWGEAAEKYRASLDLKRHPMTLYALGVAQRESEQPLAALRSFRAFLAEPASGDDAKTYRAAAQAAVDALVKEVGRVVVRAAPAHATVRVDGRACGETPCFVAPGAHEVVVAAPGYEGRTRAVKVDAGGTVDVDVALVQRDTPVWPIVLMSVGGGALVGGIVLTAVGVDGGMSSDVSSPGTVAQIAVGNALMATGLASVAAGWTWLALEPDADVGAYVAGGTAGLRIRF